MASLVITTDDLQELNRATFSAFLDSGKYSMTKTEAYEQFGKALIDTLINNHLLKDYSDLPGKCRFLICDIIAGIAAWKKI